MGIRCTGSENRTAWNDVRLDLGKQALSRGCDAHGTSGGSMGNRDGVMGCLSVGKLICLRSHSRLSRCQFALRGGNSSFRIRQRGGGDSL